jgi:hypothetical protein
MAGKRGVVRTLYTPRNPSKYVGEYPIVCRSSWETQVASYCDLHPDVIEWASEPREARVPYPDPTTMREGKPVQRIYIPDFLIMFKDAGGNVRRALCEVKPSHEALDSEVRKGSVQALLKNKAKWAAAEWWCQRRGIEFMLLTENKIFSDQKLRSDSKPIMAGQRSLKETSRKAPAKPSRQKTARKPRKSK